MQAGSSTGILGAIDMKLTRLTAMSVALVVLPVFTVSVGFDF